MDELDPDVQELYEYLKEVLGDYERYVKEIGRLGMAAPQLLYYRDEVQELLTELRGHEDLDLKPLWARVAELDNVVRAQAKELVREVGHANFKQYQIVNDPPQTHWWWYLNRVTAPPEPLHPPTWQFWRKGPAPPEGGGS